MKSLIILFSIILIHWNALAAERPENVPSKLSELRAKSWYHEQFESWNRFLEDNPTDKLGWLEAFKAAKYSGASLDVLVTLSRDLETKFPGSAEALYAKAKVIGWSDEGIGHLQSAMDDLVDDSFLLEDQLLLSEVKMNGKRSVHAGRVFESGLIAKSTLSYGYNVLMSVGENGVLFTDATHTTVPLWVLQDVMSVRQDVVIISLELSSNKNYFNQKLLAAGLNAPASGVITSLPEANTSKDFYYALTLPRKNLTNIENQLYVVGLASQLASERLDHFESLRRNIEDKFLMDYLTINFDGEPNASTGRVLEQNYIVPFMLLKEYYDGQGESENAERWKDKVIAIAERSNIKERVLAIIDNQPTEPTDFVKVDLDIKKLDKKWRHVKGSHYASETEITNEKYFFFLKYLEQHEYKELLEIAKIKGSSFSNDPTGALASYYPTHPAFSEYPAIEVSFEGANLYCEWLTAQYNRQDKRKYKKVRFRLPSQKEWTMAALGYKDFQSWNLNENTVQAQMSLKGKYLSFDLSEHTISYPWYGRYWELRNSITNTKNCFLANVKTTDEVVCPSNIKGDGWTLTSLAGAYFPNGMGLYDVIGNVAEMTDVKGIAMGGSWNHAPDECTISSVVNYCEPMSTVGFRLFMDVIEE